MQQVEIKRRRQFATVLPIPGTPQVSPRALRRQRTIVIGVVLIPFVGFLTALILLWGRGVGYVEFMLMLVMYVVSVLGIEVGFHRLFAHQSFQTNRLLRAAFAVCGSLAAQGPVIFWVAIHRRHHAYSDRPGDPHSPNLNREGFNGSLRGLWHAHVGWLFNFENTEWARYAPDLLRDRTLFRLNQLYPLWIFLGLLVPTVLGAVLTQTWSGAVNGFVWGGLARICLVHHSVWSVNSLCHSFGSRAFPSGDLSRNNIFLTPFSMGGSWHNNHHAFPASAKAGLSWWQIDPSGWLIQILEAMGLAWNVKRPSAEMIEKAKRTH
ncbi:MAG TPA: acyl-CoA desaturase [Pyrinomonadaceae bacterium]|nr:acyl-CoA desaturase [Pyrinomonadaceae bacterium]